MMPIRRARIVDALLWAVLIACALVFVAGCSTASMRRDLDVTGTLPKLIGLGGFAPACLAFCFVSNTVSQGDAVQDLAGTEAITIHDTREGAVTLKPKGAK